MDREQATGLFDLGLSIAQQAAASTASPIDDTVVRYLKFARGDASFQKFLDWKFGPRPAPLLAEGETPINPAVLAIVEDSVAPEAQELNASAELFARRENLSDEQKARLVSAVKTIFSLVKLLSQFVPAS